MLRTLCVLVAWSTVCLAAPPQSEDAIRPFLAQHCLTCHNARSGRLNLEALAPSRTTARNGNSSCKSSKAARCPLRDCPAPPMPTAKPPIQWIHTQFDRADAAAKPVAGRVTARRLNRAEYNNTVRDLLAVDFRPAEDFPQDDSGYGFDTIGDALSLSPVLMEKYFAAAEKIARTAIFGPEKLAPTVVRHQPPYREGTDGGDNSRFLSSLPYTITDYDLSGLTLPSALHAMHTFPAEGDYEFRIDPEGNRPRPSDPFQVAIWIDGKQVQTAEFEATANPTAMEGLDQIVTVHAPAGEHWVAVSALRLYEGLPEKYGGLHPTTRPEPPAPPQAFAGAVDAVDAPPALHRSPTSVSASTSSRSPGRFTPTPSPRPTV